MNLSAKQILASVLGAVLAALALSYLGAAGTIVGVAVGSASATLGTAVVFHSLEKGHRRVRKILERPLSSAPSVPVPPPADDLAISAPLGDHGISVQPAVPLPASLARSGRSSGRHWSITAAIALVFAVSLGVITVIELTMGESFSDVVGQRDSAAKTSLGGLFSGTTTTSSTTSTSETTTPSSTTSGRVTTTSTSSTSTTSTSTTTTTTSTTTSVP